MTLLSVGVTAKSVVGAVGMVALQGTAIALIAWTMLRLFKVRAPAWQAAVWLIVLVKFVLPWGPAMPYSLSDLIDAIAHHGDKAAVLPALDGSTRVALAGMSSAAAVGWAALVSLWIAGAAFVFARAVIAHRGAVRAARAAGPAPRAAHALFAELGDAMRVRRARLAVGDASTGPFVVGVLRPIVVVPPALVAAESEPLLRAAVLHELAHVRRGDAFARALQLVATSLFFFFPLVRAIGRRLDHAREAACDAWALEAAAVERPTYARLLLSMATLRTAAAPSLAMPRALDARVAAVLGAPTRARLGAVHWIALVAWAALSLGGARTASARGQADTCHYTPKLAELLYASYPQADTDGDGQLSKAEACDLQTEVRKAVTENRQVSELSEPAVSELLAEPLCCKGGPADEMTCKSEGADR
ncbi:MAG TPA: M56 family metallopeptidase [Kofleriaceae bacterium]|jgi:beta-lactamase regulating signal transducer with metallopeptidase domain